MNNTDYDFAESINPWVSWLKDNEEGDKDMKPGHLTYNIGNSDYSKHSIQPWQIWSDYNLNPWDADLVKRILRTKIENGMSMDESRLMDYKKMRHIIDYRIGVLEDKIKEFSKEKQNEDIKKWVEYKRLDKVKPMTQEEFVNAMNAWDMEIDKKREDKLKDEYDCLLSFLIRATDLTREEHMNVETEIKEFLHKECDYEVRIYSILRHRVMDLRLKPRTNRASEWIADHSNGLVEKLKAKFAVSRVVLEIKPVSK